MNIYEELKKKTIINFVYYYYYFCSIAQTQNRMEMLLFPQMISNIQNNNMKNVSINVDETEKKKVRIINIYISR